MLATHRAAQRQRFPEDLFNRLISLLLFSGNFTIDHDIDMDVPVSGMTEVDNRDIVPICNHLYFSNHLRHFRTRHTDILVELVRVDLAQRSGHRAADLPERFTLFRSFRDPGLHDTERFDNFTDLSHLLGEKFPIAVNLDNQHRLSIVRHLQIGRLAHTINGSTIHKFQGGRNDFAANDRRNRLRSTVDGVEQDQHGFLGFRQGQQLDDDFGDDGEGSLTAAHQLGQVVTHHPLHGRTPGFDNITGRGHHLKTENVILGDPVLDTARSTGTLGDVAAQSGKFQRGRIGRVKQADFLHRLLKLLGHHAGLDSRHQVFFINLKNPVKPGHHQHYPTLGRQTAAGKTAARATRKNRDFMLVDQLHDPADFLRCARMHHDIGQKLALGGVIGVADQIGFVRFDMLLADNLLEFCDKLCVQHRSQPLPRRNGDRFEICPRPYKQSKARRLTQTGVILPQEIIPGSGTIQ